MPDLFIEMLSKSSEASKLQVKQKIKIKVV